MPSRYQQLHAEEAELSRLERLGKPAGPRLAEVRAQMMAHHDRAFAIDTSDDAVARRLGYTPMPRSRPGSDFKDEGR